MKVVHLPKTALILGRRCRLNWESNASLNGWYAEVNPRVVRELAADPRIDMRDAEADLASCGGVARFGHDESGPYLCVYRRA